MYVDKKLGGVNAVQTLSRLNRTHPGKQGVMVLDFANEAEEIRKAFEPYYETTLLSEATDPNLLYEVQDRLLGFGVFAAADVEAFARVCFDPGATQEKLYAALELPRQRFGALAADEGQDFRGQLGDYVQLYSFLSQVLTFADVDLEKLYVFARHLRRLLPADRDELPREVQQNIDMESFGIQQTSRGRIALERQGGALDPAGSKPGGGAAGDELEPLSRIIEALNERFGLQLGPEHRLTLERLRTALDGDATLDASARVNTRENVRLTFDPKVEDRIQEISTFGAARAPCGSTGRTSASTSPHGSGRNDGDQGPAGAAELNPTREAHAGASARAWTDENASASICCSSGGCTMSEVHATAAKASMASTGFRNSPPPGSGDIQDSRRSGIVFWTGCRGRGGPAGGQPGVGAHRSGEDTRRGASGRASVDSSRPAIRG